MTAPALNPIRCNLNTQSSILSYYITARIIKLPGPQLRLGSFFYASMYDFLYDFCIFHRVQHQGFQIETREK
jgi:hypothetical protein